jgi:hypothetical protein
MDSCGLFHVEHPPLFSDTELAEHLIQDILIGDFAGNFTEAIQRIPKIHGDEFTRSCILE